MLLLSDELDLHSVLDKIVTTATELSGATYGALGILSEDRQSLSEFVTTGLTPAQESKMGPRPTGKGVLGLLTANPRPMRLDDVSKHKKSVGFPPHHPIMKSFLGVPVFVGDKIFGNLYLCDKKGADSFTQSDEDLVLSFAQAAGLAVEKARLHRRLRGLVLVEDRERIARDLHDTVIQRLFADGLALQALANSVSPPKAAERINQIVTDLDETIREIRSTIFAMQQLSSKDNPGNFRTEITSLIDEIAGNAGLDVEINITGSQDGLLSAKTKEHLMATTRELLTNVTKHAKADRVWVEINFDKPLVLKITDNGLGYSPRAKNKGFGLNNVAERAAILGGEFSINKVEEGGTEVKWMVND